MNREPLSELRVINACPASWDGMKGNGNVRHCSECKKNVFNISNMTRAEALALVEETEGHVCVRYYQRKDGTILTKDCSIKDRVRLKAGLLVAALAGAIGVLMNAGCMTTTGDVAPPSSAPTPSPAAGKTVMGDLATPTPPITTPVTGIATGVPRFKPKPINPAPKVLMGEVSVMPVGKTTPPKPEPKS